MKRGIKLTPGQITVDLTLDGESIEDFLRKQKESKTPIQATANIGYSERKDGVLPMYDIRTDKWNIFQSEQHRVYADTFAQMQKEINDAAQNGEIPIGEA